MVNSSSSAPLDDLDRAILAELQGDGRVSFSELGRRVSLSAPAVTERVRRLEERGIITGYRATVDPAALGLGIEAVIRVADHTSRLRPILADLPNVVDAKHVTGDDCWIVRVLATDMEALEQIVGVLARYGSTTTSLVFSSLVSDRPVVPPG